MTATPRPCRSCGAEVYDLRNVGTGNLAPVNVECVPDGNIRIDLEAGTYRIVGRNLVADPKPVDLHESHFRTCPQAGRWRRKLPAQ